MNRIKYFIPVFFLYFGLLPSCEPDPLRLSWSQKKVVDSIVQVRKVAIREELDSLCDVQYAEEIQQATDSILEDRMSEIRRKIEADAKKN